MVSFKFGFLLLLKMTQKWRLIEKGSYDAFTNMAIDEALALSVKKTNVPVIRLGYRWNPAVSLGINQNSNDIDIDFCKKNKINIVRRPSGGEALFHSPEDFTYCVIVNPEGRYKNFMDSYYEICSWIMNALKNLDIKTDYDLSTSILAKGKKICGNAQTRVLGPILQHGSVFYSTNLETLEKIFNIKKEKINEKTTCIQNFGEISFDDIYEAFWDAFLQDKEFSIDKLNNEELKTVKDLIEKKYKTDDWNFNDKKPEKGSCHVKWN